MSDDNPWLTIEDLAVMRDEIRDDERWRREYMQMPPMPPRCEFVDEDGEQCTREAHGWTGPSGVPPRMRDGHRFGR